MPKIEVNVTITKEYSQVVTVPDDVMQKSRYMIEQYMKDVLRIQSDHETRVALDWFDD